MILGHERQIEYLNTVLRRGSFAHAYLFCGPEEVGKFTVAKLVAQFFHCEKQPGSLQNVCGDCAQCRSVEAGLHPQVIFLDEERTLVSKKDKRKDIPIEDIRELKRLFVYAPEGDKWRIALLNHADKMSLESSNAFLKLLEEPGSNTLLILISSSPELLLPTILSRVQILRFSYVSDKVLEDFFSPRIKEASLLKDMLKLADGRIGLMFNFLEDEAIFQKEKNFFDTVCSVLKSGQIPEVLRVSEKISQDDNLRRKGAEVVIRVLREKLLRGVALLNNNSSTQGLKEISRTAEIMETTNVNPRLAMDILLLEAANVIHRTV